ncbi:MAG TPA: dehydrogenase [Planctomycetaceae bacterium]|nr:dehydrogenase [Planctomycetaceae bacterium]
MTRATRRKFIKTTSALGASFLISGTRASGNILGANERVRVAVAGLHSRGGAHIHGWKEVENVEIAYLADPDTKQVDRRLAEVPDSCQGIADIRTALDDKNVDAISIATPNHWHSLMTIWGAQAGKHVYVEKPLSHDIAEGRAAVAAQEKYGVVIQHGTQRRSDAGIAGLHEAIHRGDFPKLKIAYGYSCKPRRGIGFETPSQAPGNLDWDLWRGPAVVEEYHSNLVHYNWHWFWSTGNGELNNQGTHQLDIARWAIDKDQTHPVRAMAIGGRFQWKDQGETPNTLFGIAEYPNGQCVFFNVRNVDYPGFKQEVINEYYLEDGSKITGESQYEITRPGSKPERLEIEPGDVTPGGPWNSFIAAVRANDPSMVNGNVVDAHFGSVMGHLINNSYRLGKQVPFHAKSGKFGDNADAAEHFQKLHAIMQNDVGVPVDGSVYTVGPWLTFDPKTETHTGAYADEANALLKNENRKGYEIPSLENI